ncbi:MAG: SMP-30/gluconolactonase/LRE family protein [Hyphomicrobiales bacterium]
MKVLQAEALCKSKDLLGESPVWIAEENAIYWVDLTNGYVNCYKNQKHQRFIVEDPITGFSLHKEGGFICATNSGFSHLKIEGSTAKQILIDPIFEHKADFRMNDCALDRQGRFWAGSLQIDNQQGIGNGKIYCLENNNSESFLDGLVTQNGLAWSPSGDIMYVSDSHPTKAKIWQYDFCVEQGIPTNKRLFATQAITDGRPDGATVDTDGCYWIAASDSGKILRLTPSGSIDAIIEVPTRNVTNICFGGSDLKSLYITSQIYKFPNDEAGNLFVVDTPWQGISDTKYI